MADFVGAALLVVLETLAPAERLAFVLHDMFAVPFEDIAPIVGRTPAAARQLASRARRRVQGTPCRRQIPTSAASGQSSMRSWRRRAMAISKACSQCSIPTSCSVQIRRPSVSARSAEIRGAAAVAETFKGRAQAAKPALVDGAMALAVIFGRQLRIVLRFTIAGDRIVAVDAVADAERIGEFDVEVLDA